MDAVIGPIFGRGFFYGGIEHFLEGDEDGAEFCGEGGDYFLAGGDVGFPIRGDDAALEDEGLAQDEARCRKAGAGEIEQHAVHGFVAVDFHAIAGTELVPGIVDADEDADDIRGEVDAVAFPTGVEVDDPVAADAAVENAEAGGGVIGEKVAGDAAGVAVAEGAVVVGLILRGAIAAAVGDGISLEQDDLVLTYVHRI